MPINDMFPRNALGGWLAGEQLQHDQAARRVQQAIGLASLLDRQRAAEQEEQFAPLKMQLLQAQAAQARGLADERTREQAFTAQLPDLVRQATGEDGTLDWGRLTHSLAQVPGGLKPAMDLRRTDEDRATRLQQAQLLHDQRVTAAQQHHETRMMNARTAEERAAEAARHNRVMEGFTGQMRALAASNASNRQYPIVQTAEGIFERRPEGLVRMTDPQSGQPLRPASLSAGDRGDRRDSMSIYQQVENDPQVKLYKSIAPKFDTAAEYFKQVQADPSKQSNASDLALVKTFVSMIHPKGDQISNLDMRNINQLPGIDERIVGAVINVIDGRQLQPKMRADIMRLMSSQFGNLNSQVVGIEDRRRQEAQNFGLDPDRSVPRIGRRQEQKPSSPRVIDFNDLPRR